MAPAGDERDRSSGPLTVLLVEDSDDDVWLLRRALQRDGIGHVELVRARRLADAEQALAEKAFDAVLLDLSLPDSFGVATVRRVHASAPATPIVVLTSMADVSLGLEALEEGAQDYLVKGQAPGRLLERALRYAIVRQQHQEQARLLVEEKAARASAEAALRARDEFLLVAAHELYTPITALQLAAQSTLSQLRAPRRPDPASLARKLEIVERQAVRLGRLVETFLEVSRLRAGQFELALEEVDLADVLAAVADSLEPELVRSGSTLRLHGARSMTGRWDRGRLEQVVTNLLANAIKYGAGQPIDVTLRGDRDTATLAVADHGIGIDPELLSRIFDRFERAAPIRHYGGLGLGLYVVRRVVSALGGSVAVVSRPGAGSTFTVELPRHRQAAAQPHGGTDGR